MLLRKILMVRFVIGFSSNKEHSKRGQTLVPAKDKLKVLSSIYSIENHL